jgi:peptidoglycan hydrolase-like protein with peptidoglycan-binding domain/predicted chitinase
MANGHGRSTEGFGIDRDSSVNLIVRTAIENGVDDPRQIAYMLATAQHETEDFKAREEHFGRSQAAKLGYSGGDSYYGRGYVHLTHDYNYRQFDELLGLNGELVRNPDKAKDPEIAAKILVVGMRDGLFTGRRLDRHINDDTQDYYSARRVVNGVSARQPWSVKAAEDCERYAGEWERLAPGLIEDARKQVASESFDPVRDLQQTVARITGVDNRDPRIMDGMPEYLRNPGARPDGAMNDGILGQGERGPAVRALQERLNSLGVTDGRGQTLEADGAFGRNTRDAVENFQLWHGLPTTGVADRGTLRAIRLAQTPNNREGENLASEPPRPVFTPDQPGFPYYQQALGAIRNSTNIPAGIFTSHQEECLAGCLAHAALASTPPLRQIDSVVVGHNNPATGIPDNAFAVQGGLTDPAHLRAHTALDQALRTPLEQSSEIVNQLALARQQELQQLQQTQQIDAPSQHAPVMKMSMGGPAMSQPAYSGPVDGGGDG